MGKASREKRNRIAPTWDVWQIGEPIRTDSGEIDDQMGFPVFNNIYTVYGRVCHVEGMVIHGQEVKEMVHLSIKRNDREHVIDWRDKLRIKNELCGPESEAVELYPSMNRVVDGANQFHLWVIGFAGAPKTKAYSEDAMERQYGLTFPFGFTEGRKVSDQDEARKKSSQAYPSIDSTKLRQRKLPSWMTSEEELDQSIKDATSNIYEKGERHDEH
jgi:hypothetical protein